MEYQVPQFIEVESKVVGPLTLKQFIYVAGASGLCIIFFTSLQTIFAVMLSLPVVALAAALVFYTVNGKPFIEVLEAGFNYYMGAKLFLWKRQEPKKGDGNAAAAAAAAEVAPRKALGTPRLTRGKLSELAWSLDISARGGSASGEQQK